ncbi:hypothetical protein PTTG_12247 [Puccinia triticina 1-1 BBBD Race 1]|uniref:DUF7918 domain-containing protein n=1 Tax=Puccinia triticina (isolate 1-1 / race 1 (BBBD)) TaxID=630390 RepID=A0A180GIM9_PUCT1|nr:hypothetical protein PTTG_12247 [Puccinia triticina 1-1 BBBD Race 1]
MPTNAVSGASCTISILDPSSTISMPCTEYLQESLKDPETGAYQEVVTIESTQSSPFEITVDIHPTAYDLLAKRAGNGHSGSRKPYRSLKLYDYTYDIFLDGVYVTGMICNRCRKPGPETISEVIENNTVRSFQFAPLKLVDPDSHLDNHQDTASASKICEDSKIIESLGTIEVRVHKCHLSLREIKTKRKKRKEDELTMTSSDMSFLESSKQVRLSSTAGLSEPALLEPVSSPKAKGKRYVIKSEEENPFLQFIFKYRPRSILIAEGIIPTPTIGNTEDTAIIIGSDHEGEVKEEDQDDEMGNVGGGKGNGCERGSKKRAGNDDAGVAAETSDPKRSRFEVDEKPDITGLT